MKYVYFFYVILLFLLKVQKNYGIDLVENLDKLGVSFYEELGCAPIGNKSYPEGYNCPERKPGVCTLRGLEYKHGEKIENPTACDIGCECFIKGLKSFILCDYQECEEKNPPPNCKMGFDLENTCCKTKEICPPLDFTCEIEGMIYNEGELFRPSETCLVCVCRRDFIGKYEYPFCQRDVFGVELFHPAELESNCAPVYLSPRGSILCTPARYICKKDLINFTIKTENTHQFNSTKKCNFAGNIFDKGDVIEVEYGDWPFSSKISCECLMPPQIACFDFD